jgi:hypothetical protein
VNCRVCNAEPIVVRTSKSARMDVRKRHCPNCKESWETTERETPGTRQRDESATSMRLVARASQPGRSPDAVQSQIPRASDPLPSSDLRSSFPLEASDPERARSEKNAKVWAAYDWNRKFGNAWREKYGRDYGNPGDSKSTGLLAEALALLSDDSKLAAQAEAPRMFAEFLAKEDPRTVERRHCWAFFVQEWGSLRVPKLRVAAKPVESFAERDARIAREKAEAAKKASAEAARLLDAKLAADREVAQRLPTADELAALRNAKGGGA